MNTIFLRAYATIPDMINDIFGTNFPSVIVNTYGFFVAMGFLAAAVISFYELKRRHDLKMLQGYHTKVWKGKAPVVSDLILPIFLGGFLGLKLGGVVIYGVENTLVGQNDALNYIFSLQGSILGAILGALAYGGYTFYSIKKEQLPEPKQEDVYIAPQDQIGNMVAVAAIFGVLGSNIFEMFQPGFRFENFIEDPTVLFSGLTIYGGLIFGIIGMLIYTRWAKLKPFLVFDSLSIGFLVAYGIGRMGCHFSGDGDWGIVNNTPAPSWIPEYFWSNTYAYNVINEGVRIPGCVGNYCYVLPEGVWPTSIYEIFMCFILAGIMWAVRKKVTAAPGFMFCILFVFNGIERFLIETIRVTDRYENFFNLTQAQIISIGLIIAGISGMVYLYKKYKPEIQAATFK
jgi:phosphatidylglycerol---prolipoprotein diacylglyceryl transferase